MRNETAGLAPIGPNMSFVANYSYRNNNSLPDAHKIMRCFAPDKLPAFTTLAREFAVCLAVDIFSSCQNGSKSSLCFVSKIARSPRSRLLVQNSRYTEDTQSVVPLYSLLLFTGHYSATGIGQ